MDRSNEDSTSRSDSPAITKDDPFSTAWENIGKIAQQMKDLEQKRRDDIHGFPQPPKAFEPFPQNLEARERIRGKHDTSRSFEDDADFFHDTSSSSRFTSESSIPTRTSSTRSPYQDKDSNGHKVFHGTVDHDPNSRSDRGWWKQHWYPLTGQQYWDHRGTGMRLIYQPRKLNANAAEFKLSYAAMMKRV